MQLARERCVSILNASSTSISSWASRVKTSLSDYNYDVVKTDRAKLYRMELENVLNSIDKLKRAISTGSGPLSASYREQVQKYRIFSAGLAQPIANLDSCEPSLQRISCTFAPVLYN